MDNYQFWRLGVFLLVMAIMMILEIVIPHREAVHSRRKRWPGNLLVLFTGNLLLRIIPSLLPYSLALAVAAQGGRLPERFSLHPVIFIALTILFLDLAIYFQHLLFHRIPFLRALHRMHHSDTHVDVTTALRFHPLEIFISTLYKGLLIFFLGLPPLGVLLFEILLNGAAMFNHANIQLPEKGDALLRLFVVTPDFHRIHHSRLSVERNSNYGFFLPFWDRIFSTYRAEALEDKRRFPLGLPGYDDARIHRLDRLLLDPLRPWSSGEKRE